MSKISQEKEGKIMSDILGILYDNSLKALFTAEISRIISRDEEFVKRLLQDMREKGLVVSINLSPQGMVYLRRLKWRLSGKAYDAYKKLHSSQASQTANSSDLVD